MLAGPKAVGRTVVQFLHTVLSCDTLTFIAMQINTPGAYMFILTLPFLYM
jgi:hypothetical protein